MAKRDWANIKIPSQAHRKAGVLAAFTGTSIGSLLEQLVDERYAKSGLPEPSAESIAAKAS